MALGSLLALAIAGAVLLGTATTLSRSRTDVDTLAYGDGLIYRYVAGHLTTPPSEIDPVVSERGTSLRYGRIGLPILIWLLAAGRNQLMPYTHVIVILLSAAAAGAAAVALLGGSRPGMSAAIFLAPAVPLAISGGFAEITAIAFALWAARCVMNERWSLATVLLSCALLTRENAGFVVLGLTTWVALTGRRFAAATVLSVSILPLLGWYAFVSVRFGHLPFLDPYLRTATDTVGLPVVALAESILQPASGAALIVLLLHLTGAVAVLLLGRRRFYGWLALSAATQLLFSGPFAWSIVGEAMRTPAFLQVFLVFWAISERSGDRASSAESVAR